MRLRPTVRVLTASAALAASAARPHVLRAQGSRSNRTGYAASNPVPAWGRGPASRTGGGRENPNRYPTDLGPGREGGRKGLENRRIGRFRKDAPRKCSELRGKVEQPGTGKPCPLRVSHAAPKCAGS